MTNEEAEQLLKELSRHYREPVMPVGRYCDALTTWLGALNERTARLRNVLYPDMASEDRTRRDQAWEVYYAERNAGDRYALARKEKRELGERDYGLLDLRAAEEAAETVGHVFLQIRKSNLLARLIYEGQPLRTRMCPVHKGKWSGCMWPKDAKDACACMDGSNVTGWLPEGSPPATETPPPPQAPQEGST